MPECFGRCFFYEPENNDVSAFSDPDPGLGAVKLDINRWSNGQWYSSDSISGVANDIWNALLTIAQAFYTTAGSVIQSIVDYTFSTINKYQGSSAELRYTHSYPDKNVSVWTNSGWVLYVTSRTREWYKLHVATWTTSAGFTDGGSFSYLPPNYSYVHINYAPHYNDHNWLFDTAYIRWDSGYAPGWMETW